MLWPRNDLAARATGLLLPKMPQEQASMSDPIKVGDLVMVTRSCCTKRVTAVIYKVGSIAPIANRGVLFCLCCNRWIPNIEFAGSEDGSTGQPIT